VPFLNTLKNNFEYFVSLLNEKGYINEDFPIELWEEVGYNYNILRILPLMNSIEKSTYEIDAVSDWINPYSYYIDYGEQEPVHWYQWKNKELNKFSLVKRWLDWMNYNHKIFIDEQQKHQYLWVESDTEESDVGSYSFLYDEDGEEIITLEGYFSEGRTNNI
jgi:hypothetical protein